MQLCVLTQGTQRLCSSHSPRASHAIKTIPRVNCMVVPLELMKD